MKKLCILAIASLVGSAAMAQESASGTTPRPMSFGIKAGVNLPKYHYDPENGSDSETKSTTNFNVTGYLDAPLGGNFSIQPGISLQGKGGKFTENETAGTTFTHEHNTMWIEVPVNFVAKVPISGETNFYIGAGPYLGFGIAGKDKYTTTTTAGGTTTTTEFEDDIKFSDREVDESPNYFRNLKGTDFGVNILAGVKLGGGFNVGAQYGLGLTDLRQTENSTKLTNRVLGFSVGFEF